MELAPNLVKQDPKRVASAALQAFFSLSSQWGLKTNQERILLGSPPPSTFFKWKSEKSASRLNRDVVERVSYLLGIYKALQILMPNKDTANRWLSKPNDAPLFNGQSALDRMLAGNVSDLAVVRQYLDAQRGL